MTETNFRTASATVTPDRSGQTGPGGVTARPSGPVTPDPRSTVTGQTRGPQTATAQHHVTGEPVTPTADDPTADDSTNPGRRPIPTALKWGTNITVWAMSAIATFVAGIGQVQHARDKDVKPEPLVYLFPAALECTSIAFMLLGYVRARHGKSPWLLWAISIGFGGWAVRLQLDHAGAAGALFATTTVAALVLWFAKLTGDYRDHLDDTDRGGLGLLWLTDVRLAVRATLVKAKCRKIKNTSRAIELGLVWIATYDDVTTDPASGEKLKGRMRRRHAWRCVFQAAGMSLPTLPSMTTLERVGVTAATPTVPPPPPPVTRDRWSPPTSHLTEPTADQLVVAPDRWPPTYGPVTRTGQTTSTVTGRAPVAPARPARPRLVEAPVSPAVGGPQDDDDDELVIDEAKLQELCSLYSDHLATIRSTIKDWQTREKRVTTGEISRALGNRPDGKPVVGGKETLLRIRAAVEYLSHRASIPVPKRSG